MTFEPGVIVAVPFPFTDSATTKRRPAVVLSTTSFNVTNDHAILAMITTAKHSRWQGDVPIRDWKQSGLPKPCIIRLKLFTLDLRFVEKKIGQLSPRDTSTLRKTIGQLLFTEENEAR